MTDLGVVATEEADQVSAALNQPQLSSCSYLLCGPCLEKVEGHRRSCSHLPPHPVQKVSTLSSSLSASEDHVTTSRVIPTKVQALIQDLKQHIDEQKCVIFSFWTSTLDIIEECLNRSSIRFMRFDGKVLNSKRATLLKSFHEDEGVRVALMTISCGSVGLDLTPASRAYLMEPHWNPSVESQALARIYRMGQKRPVTTIRYIMRDSFEDHVINVQNRKQHLTKLLLSPGEQGSTRNSHERLKHFRSLIDPPGSTKKARTLLEAAGNGH